MQQYLSKQSSNTFTAVRPSISFNYASPLNSNYPPLHNNPTPSHPHLHRPNLHLSRTLIQPAHPHQPITSFHHQPSSTSIIIPNPE